MTEQARMKSELTWVSAIVAVVTILLLLGLYWTTQGTTVNECVREHRAEMGSDAAWELCSR